MVCAIQLRQREPDRASRQPVEFPQSIERSGGGFRAGLEPGTICAQRALRLSEDGERDQSGAERFDDPGGGASAPRANWILWAGAKRGGSAADDSARPFW